MRNDKANLGIKLAAAVGLALVFAGSLAKAQVVINQFDSAAEVSQWGFNFGGISHTEVFDPTVDVDGNPCSGSMKITLNFDNVAHAGNNKAAYLRGFFPGLDGTMFDTIKMDVMVDPSSAVDAFGNNGIFSLVLRYGAGFHYVDQTSGNLNSVAGWMHFEKSPLTPDPMGDTLIRGATIQIYGDGIQNLTGPVTLWIDNFVLSGPEPVPPPPPLVIERTVPGLQITATIPNETFQRQDIRTTNSGFSWLIPGDPAVTYSFTITNFPNETYNAFEAHLFLVGNSPSPGQFGDYNQPNVVYLRIYDAGPEYTCQLRYKANSPNLSGAAATLVASFSSPTVIGTWGMTLQGLNATAFGSSGAMASGTLGMDVETAFDLSTHLYLGMIPNDNANIGQSVTFSTVSVTGGSTPFAENFSTLNNWTRAVAQDPAGVLLKPSGTFALISWPSPSIGYTLHATNALGPAEVSWPFAGLCPETLGTNKVVTLGPGQSQRFFRLENPNP